MDCLDRDVGVERVIVTIVRRVADPGDSHRGLINVPQIDPAPSHQALDLMTIMPHVEATGILVHTPVTHGHIITVVPRPRGRSPRRGDRVLRRAPAHPVVTIDEGFLGNAALFRYARDLGNPRGDMYEIAALDETVGGAGGAHVRHQHPAGGGRDPPESVDAVRAALSLQTDRLEAVGLTNQYLGLK